MKKLLSLLLALIMCASLAACGGGDDATSDDGGTGVVTDEALKPLAEAYNKIAPIYNEAYENADANGWMEDEQTAAELQTLGATLSGIGAGLTGESDMLEGADIDGMVETLEGLVPAVQELAERVSVPYEG